MCDEACHALSFPSEAVCDEACHAFSFPTEGVRDEAKACPSAQEADFLNIIIFDDYIDLYESFRVLVEASPFSGCNWSEKCFVRK